MGKKGNDIINLGKNGITIIMQKKKFGVGLLGSNERNGRSSNRGWGSSRRGGPHQTQKEDNDEEEKQEMEKKE